jgi:hypothetical protein
MMRYIPKTMTTAIYRFGLGFLGLIHLCTHLRVLVNKGLEVPEHLLGISAWCLAKLDENLVVQRLTIVTVLVQLNEDVLVS